MSDEPKPLTDALRSALEVARLEQMLDPAARLTVTLPSGRYRFDCDTPGPISLAEALAAAWPEDA